MTPALLLAAAVACSSPYVVDGDTLQCGPARVRLYGVQAPELAHFGRRAEPFAAEATRRLQALTRGPVTCREAGNSRDRYGRMVARCSGPGTPDLGRRLVREGWATDWSRYSGGEYLLDEVAAHKAGVGRWK